VRRAAVLAVLIAVACAIQACSKRSDVPFRLLSVSTLAANGGRVSWSPDGEWIAFDRKGSDGFFDVWVVRPDASDERCLTCGHPEMPAGNIGNPEWHPSGEYMVIQVEDPLLPIGSHTGRFDQYAASPGIGLNNNLWILSANGIATWQLTEVVAGRGTLHPQFSHNGELLLWCDIARPGVAGQVMRLATIQFVNERPELGPVETLDVGGFAFYETHGFSPDDEMILFSAYPDGAYFYGLEIYTYGLDSQRLHQLTDNDEWDEHAHFTPDGEWIIYSSSEGVPQTKTSSNVELLESPVNLELWMMRSDGSEKHRLTWINDPDAPEYVASPIGAGFGDGSWHPDGTCYVAKLRPGRGTERVVVLEIAADE